MAHEARVLLEVDDAVAALTLAGRDGTNAMDLAFVRELDELTTEVERLVGQGDVRVVSLRARGRHFCVGGDLAEFGSVTDLPAHMERMTVHAHASMARLHELTVPLVAGAQGAAAGAGWGLLLASDVVVATQSSTFRAGYAAAGLTPDAGVSWALPRRVGAARALEAILTNRRLGAEELRQWGLVSQVVPDDGLDDEVGRIVSALAALDPEVVRHTLRLVHTADDLRSHLDDEARTIAAVAASRTPTPAP